MQIWISKHVVSIIYRTFNKHRLSLRRLQNSPYIPISKRFLTILPLRISIEIPSHSRRSRDGWIRSVDRTLSRWMGCCRSVILRLRHTTGTWTHLRVENPTLCICRVVKSPMWQHALITDQITDKSYISNRTSESTYVFPLYLYPDPEELGISTERSLNFKPAFLTALSEALGLPQVAPFNLPEGVSPEEILAYIYAVLYSPKDTREEVKNMISVCLDALNHQRLGNDSIHISPHWG